MKMHQLITTASLLLLMCGSLPAQVPNPVQDPLPRLTTLPKAVCKNVTKYIDDSCLLSIVPDDIDGGSTDYNTRGLSKSVFTCADTGIHKVTLTVTSIGQIDGSSDLRHNSSCTATVTVIGETKAACRDRTVQLNVSGKATVMPRDVSTTASGDPSIEALGLSRTDFTCMDIGPNPVILTVFNTSGDQSSCSAVVTITGNSAASCTAVRWYVNAKSGNDNNDGRSWTTAFAGLQKAIEAATPGDHIWVAAGTYHPAAYPRNATRSDGSPLPDNQRYFTFQLPDGVEIYGGFAGTENYLSERCMGKHSSILNGNLGSLQVFHVVSAVSTGPGAVLDGFVITGGRAAYYGNFILVDGVPVSSANGGGIIFSQSGAQVRNVAVVGNYARGDGGGIAVLDASLRLTNITLAANSTDQRGGGLYATASALVSLINATVTNNTAKGGGSGLYVYNESSVVNMFNSVFYNNGSGQDILNESGATLGGEKTYTQQAPSAYGFPVEYYQLTKDPFSKSADPDGPDNIYGTTDDGLQLSGTSILKNTGITWLNSEAVDLMGNSRLNGNTVDIGAYEK